jgi:RNA polymerase sigma-70 factor (ECF subfamily)
LPPEARAVVVLHYYVDLTLPEVAATIGIPLGTAKSRLNRALAHLRSDLAAADTASVPVAGGQLA